MDGPYRRAETECIAHIPKYDSEEAGNLTSDQVRRKFPRFRGTCHECGFSGIAYASFEHYVAGDW